ncbi:MAG: alpha/beta hydrolase [Enterovirga sp.]|nr:alpha/beta hydrolase [Enterovirga sp.]
MDLTRRAVALGLPAFGATACSPLGTFQALTPRDSGVTRVASASYGPDPRQGLDLYAPSGQAGPLPVAVFFYGGSWKTGSRTEYAFVGHALAAQGFVVAVADYRLYPQVRFPAFLEDGAEAVRWVRENAASFGGDPRRIVLVGHSAGAYNAAMLALDGRYLRRAGVDPRAIRAFAGLSGPYDFLPFDDPTTVAVFGEAPDPAATQPIRFARPGVAAFLATGDQDATVRPRNTAVLAERLRAAGARVAERVYPGLDHKDTLLALSVLLRGKAPLLAEMTAFLHAATDPPASGDARAAPRRSG